MMSEKRRSDKTQSEAIVAKEYAQDIQDAMDRNFLQMQSMFIDFQ